MASLTANLKLLHYQDELQRVLTEEQSGNKRNRIIIWKVRKSRHPAFCVIKKIEYRSRPKGVLKCKTRTLTVSKKLYKKIIGLVRLVQELRKMPLMESPDEGIEIDTGLVDAARLYHGYIQKYFSCIFQSQILLDLLKM